MRFFDAAEQSLSRLLEPVAPGDLVRDRLQQVSARNLALYGFGAKSFTLSMMETATELCADELPTSMVRQILAIGRGLLGHPIELLPGVDEALDELAERAQLVLITKGDLYHQEAKVAASGLGKHFSGVEITSDKTVESYRRLFARYGVAPANSVMAGDSVRSDVLPALEAGAWAALVPHEIVWFYERADAPVLHPRFKKLNALADLAYWIDGIA